MKLGQISGAQPAALIVVITSFILIYILLLPVEDRNELLDINEPELDSEGNVVGSVLLDENPGTVTNLKERDFFHSIPSFSVFTKSEDETLKTAGSVHVESSGASSRAVPLFLPGDTDNVRMSFEVIDHSGELSISINGRNIFKGEISGNPDPILLDGLRDENLIEFAVAAVPSWQFWSKNFYDIRNVNVVGTVTNTENREAVQTFFVSSDEADAGNIDSSYLVYVPDCRSSAVGKLDVYLNDNLLSSKVPDCGNLERTFVDPSELSAGKNELRFVAREGNFLLDRVSLNNRLKKPILPVFFFDINSTQFAKINEERINATILLEFVNDDTRRTGVIEINDHKIFVDTRQTSFSRNIDPFVERGANSLRLVPDSTFNILKLKVLLDCRTKEDCR